MTHFLFTFFFSLNYFQDTENIEAENRPTTKVNYQNVQEDLTIDKNGATIQIV